MGALIIIWRILMAIITVIQIIMVLAIIFHMIIMVGVAGEGDGVRGVNEDVFIIIIIIRIIMMLLSIRIIIIFNYYYYSNTNHLSSKGFYVHPQQLPTPYCWPQAAIRQHRRLADQADWQIAKPSLAAWRPLSGGVGGSGVLWSPSPASMNPVEHRWSPGPIPKPEHVYLWES